ncbi:6-phosphogluconolactonase [Vulcanococcus limneticus]|uniref:6-phosphogluconolactonase n=1 Tax=Vulcanococcus limneticus TaxID=2170428 RepID=UPI00398BC59A
MSPSPARYRLEVAPGPDDLARRAAQRIATAIDLALEERDRCQIALSGGTTPAAAYRLLGQEHLPWDRVDVLLGDERWVPASDPASNARLLAETLLAQEPARQARFHPVPTELESPAASAEAFESLVRQLCPGDPPVFDLMLLGLGDDGHTASLFPGSAATAVRDRPVTVGEGKGLERITLTAPVLSAARQVIVLVSGAGKRQALERLLDPAESPERTPARLVQPRSPVLVLADAAAAEGIPAPG